MDFFHCRGCGEGHAFFTILMGLSRGRRAASSQEWRVFSWRLWTAQEVWTRSVRSGLGQQGDGSPPSGGCSHPLLTFLEDVGLVCEEMKWPAISHSVLPNQERGGARRTKANGLHT